MKVVNPAAIALGVAVGIVVFALGTASTLYFVADGSGGMLDPYKVGGTWVFLGAIAGRVMYNIRTPRPPSAEPG